METFHQKISTMIYDIDFIFRNELVSVIADRNYPGIELAGLKVGPFEEGKEYKIQFWIAEELEKAGVVHFKQEDMLDLTKLYKIHWKERSQTSKQISILPKDFYAKLKRLLLSLRKEALKAPEKVKEYEKAVEVAQDIVNCRLRKIISLASTLTENSQILDGLTMEEHSLYKQIHGTVNAWRTETLKMLRGEESG